MTDVHPPPYYQSGDRVFIKSCKVDWYIGRIYQVETCDRLVKLKGVEMTFSVDQLVPEHEVTAGQMGNLTLLPECSDKLLEMYKQEGLLFQKDGNFVIEHKTAIERVFIPADADICGGPTDKDHIKRLYEIIGGRLWMVAATVAGSGEYSISLYDGDDDERVFHRIEIEPREIIPCPFRRWKQIFQLGIDE